MSIVIVSVDSTRNRKKPKVRIQISSVDDVANLPTDVSPGSVAYMDDLSCIWNFANDGTWKEV